MDDFDSIILPEHANPIVIQWLKSGKAKIIPSGCWEWQQSGRGLRGKEYGVTRISSEKKAAVHRLAINAPSESLVLHSCNTRKCVNPSHLRLGTHHENMLDTRGRKGKNPPCETLGCGRVSQDTFRLCRRCSYPMGVNAFDAAAATRSKKFRAKQQELKK